MGLVLSWMHRLTLSDRFRVAFRCCGSWCLVAGGRTPLGLPSVLQGAVQDGDGAPSEVDAIAVDGGADQAGAGGGL